MGYILNFQNNSNNMKNEIGRKLTSLTLMTIMFAGGLTLAIPGFLPMAEVMPEAFADPDRGTTQGMLYVSSTEVQGAQVVAVVVSDPGAADPTITQGALSMDFNTNTLYLQQVTDGTWVAYIADDSSATDADSASFQFGTNCNATLTSTAAPAFINGDHQTWISDTDCTAPNATYNAAAMNVLGDAATIMNAGTTSTPGPLYNGQTGLDLPQWPIITAFEFSATNYLTYGDDTVVMTWGPQNAGSSISAPTFVTQGANVPVTIDDNGLNMDPTTAETWTMTTSTTARTTGATTDIDGTMPDIGFGENINISVTDGGSALTSGTTYVFIETGSNTGIFTTHDVLGASTVDTKTNADVDDSVTLGWGGATTTFTVATSNATASLDAGAEWMPGEPATFTLNDPDMNRLSGDAEVLDVSADNIIPTIIIGEPKFLIANDIGNGSDGQRVSFAASDADSYATAIATIADMGDNSKRVKVTLAAAGTAQATSTLTINTQWDATTFLPKSGTTDGAQMLYYDICSIADNLVSTDIAITLDGTALAEPGPNSCSGEIQQDSSGDGIDGDASVDLVFVITHDSIDGTAGDYVIAADLHTYSVGNRADGIYRMEAVETGPDTGVFEGTVSYVLMNTVQASDGGTFKTPADYTVSDGSDLIIMLDNYATGSSAPRINYGDTDVLGSANTTVGAQLDANTHSGVVSWDQTSYAVGDAATVTIVDPDLNVDSALVETYVGDGSFTAGTDMFAVTCDDAACTSAATIKLVEDGTDSDTFVGVFTVTDDIGEDMEIGYRDTRDATGVATIWYSTATIGSSTGTVSLDRQVYPVPFDASEQKSGDNTAFPTSGDGSISDGDVTVTVAVTDPDTTGTTLSASGGLVTIKLITGNTTTTIYTAGDTKANAAASGTILGPLSEIEQGSNVYEISFTLDETQSSHQILGGSTVIQATYADPNGDNGLATDVYDSSTFDLRNGSLTTDKSVYIMGQTAVVTLTDDDLNLDGATAESYSFALVEWDSDADSSELISTAAFTKNPTLLEETGDNTGVFQSTFDIPTGVSDGANANALELGEVITLTYRDSGPAGEASVSNVVATDTTSVDVEHTISISNFGASISLDKTVYDWTDTVNIEVVAPDHNKNSAGKETIGTAALPVKVSTRNGSMCSSYYTLKESGEDTGIFVGYITLAGLDGQAINIPKGQTSKTLSATSETCGTDSATGGPENGVVQTAGQDDGVTVTYEYNDGSVALASAIIQWNYASIEWLESSVSTDGSAVIRVTDPDEDLADTVIDQVTIDVYSDSDSGGVRTTLSETDEGTGVFEGTVNFTSTAISSGDTVRVSEGDTVTAEITDTTLPGPDYTSADTLLFAATTTVGTAFPPLERAPAANARVVDASGNSVAEVSSGQQVQIAADVTNGQGKDQAFAYLVQVQDASGVTVSLSWLTGSLTSGQSMTAAQSWTPTSSGSYTATVFVWESVSNPTALSPTVSVNIDVV